MRNHILPVALFTCAVIYAQGSKALAQQPSFDCTRAHFPDEFAICRTPELSQLDNVIAAAYAYLKATRGRAFADQIGIPFWRMRQACQYNVSCIRQRQIEAINVYQASGAPIFSPQQPVQRNIFTSGTEALNVQSDPSSELRLCRNSRDPSDKIAHCSNVVAQQNAVSALVVAHNTRGLALMDLGRFNEAIDDFTFVINHDPHIAGFYDNRQNAYRRSGLLDLALSDANKAIELAPSYAFVFHGRATVYTDMRRYDEAILDYDQAIRLAPEDGGLFIERGKIFRTQSKFDQAIADFSHALDLDKKWTAAYRERGLTYKMTGRQEQAVEDLTAYNQLQPGDQDVILALGELTNVPSPTPTVTPPLPSDQPTATAATTIVPMVLSGGIFAVPVTINGQITLKFVVDSGASDVSVPADVVMTLLRTDTITDSDFLGKQTYTLADGSTVPSQQFVIRSLKVGDKTLQNVIGSVVPVKGSLLLGQSFLARFKSWSIDNEKRALILN